MPDGKYIVEVSHGIVVPSTVTSYHPPMPVEYSTLAGVIILLVVTLWPLWIKVTGWVERRNQANKSNLG